MWAFSIIGYKSLQADVCPKYLAGKDFKARMSQLIQDLIVDPSIQLSNPQSSAPPYV